MRFSWTLLFIMTSLTVDVYKSRPTSQYFWPLSFLVPNPSERQKNKLSNWKQYRHVLSILSLISLAVCRIHPCYAANISSLVSRRDHVSQKFFRDLTHSSSCLYHLLPPPRNQSLTTRLRSYERYPRVYTHTRRYCLRLRSYEKYERAYTRTRRYCSFINYGLNNYQDKITNQ